MSKQFVHLHIIYGLFDPRDGMCYYVGQTNNLARRVGNIISDVKQRPNTPLSQWVGSLLKDGLKPERKILTESSFENRNRFEKYWITRYQKLGHPLVNIHPGGKQTPNPKGSRLSKDHRIKISKSLRGNQHAKGKTYTLTKQARQNIKKSRQQLLNDPIKGPALRQRLSEANKGKKFSTEHRQNISEAAKQRDPATRKHSEETKKKIAAANSRRVWTAESRQKASASAKARFERGDAQ